MVAALDLGDDFDVLLEREEARAPFPGPRRSGRGSCGPDEESQPEMEAALGSSTGLERPLKVTRSLCEPRVAVHDVVKTLDLGSQEPPP
jgi:hypothetical protein